MLNLNSIMVGTMNYGKMVGFYGKMLDRNPDMTDEGWTGWLVGSTFLSVYEHSEMKGKAKNSGRVMFNFETAEVKQEFERIKGLGAKIVKEPYEMGGMWIATLADPDGNYFQLMSPWKG